LSFGLFEVMAQEYYELRTYLISKNQKSEILSEFLERALIPALNRQGMDRIGAFKENNSEEASLYLLIPYKSLEQFSAQNDLLEKDKVFHLEAQTYFALDKEKRIYDRIQSSFMKAFKGMPVLQTPVGVSGPRLFELRTYESHNSDKAKLKVEMFNEGEIEIMKEVGLGPVFFGETLIGATVPNLTYMLSALNDDEHKRHWEAFRKHPKWLEMKVMPRYKGTVSNIKSTFLMPLPYSKL